MPAPPPPSRYECQGCRPPDPAFNLCESCWDRMLAGERLHIDGHTFQTHHPIESQVCGRGGENGGMWEGGGDVLLCS